MQAIIRADLASCGSGKRSFIVVRLDFNVTWHDIHIANGHLKGSLLKNFQSIQVIILFRQLPIFTVMVANAISINKFFFLQFHFKGNFIQS